MHKGAASLVAVLCSLSFLSAQDPPPVTSPSAVDFARAIRANDLIALRQLASVPGAANTVDRLHATPLHYAALYGSADAIRILLKAGADPKARNARGAAPLLYAAWDFERTRLLLESGAEANTAQTDGTTPLMVAASTQGNLATVRYLVQKGADVRWSNKQHDSAVLRSASLSDLETLRFLLESGADPRAADRAGFCPLHNATSDSDSQRIRLLLAAGAGPNQFNTSGGFVKKGPIALVHLSPLMLAAPYGDPDAITALLQSGAKVNEVDVRKMSPLMLSVATDLANPRVVQQFIAAGADVNAKDQNAESVLDWARKYRNPEILSLLVAAGATGSEQPAAPQPAAGSQAGSPAESVQRALPLLSRSGARFFQESGCAGCHHQALHARAFAAAARAGLKPDPALRQNLLSGIIAVRPFILTDLPVLNPPPGDYDVLFAYLMSLADLNEPASDSTDLMLHYIAVRQDASGAWINLGVSRAPIEESTITRTALAVRSLAHYGWPARQAEFAARIARAREWLQNAKPVTSYELADKITGLAAAGAPASVLDKEATALRKLQRPDGGWAQTPYLDSDAYATGLVLSSLYAAGLISPSDPGYRHGVDFLLRTQFADGSWYVRSRAPKFQPYFQSAFPFDQDQWISSAGTSFAVMALAPAAGPASPLASAQTRH